MSRPFLSLILVIRHYEIRVLGFFRIQLMEGLIMRSLRTWILAFGILSSTMLVQNNFAHAQGFTPVRGPTGYQTVQSQLQQIVKDFPAAHLFDLGVTDSGEMVQGLISGDGPVAKLVVATHHGNEYGSTAVGVAFARYVAEHPIAGHTIYVIPVLNVTGYNADQREENLPSGGYNTQDPNRDYPGPCVTGTSHHLKSTKLLADFVAAKNIVASTTLHTFASEVLYPWGVSTHETATPYLDQFIQLGKLAAQESGYKVGNSTDDLYPADGTFEDYAFWKHGIWSLLFEMGVTHSPSDDQVQTMINGNVPGIYRFLEQSPVTRAVDHDFHGKCDYAMTSLDLRNE
jgi:carboxypeptidase T